MTPSTPARSDDPLGLAALTTALLDPTTPASEQARACEAFHTACLAALPALDGHGTQLASGRALSPLDAAGCVLDTRRTACFLRAVAAAIAARLQHASGASVDVLYAGCGPLAPLALPLAHRFRDRRVRFTLVDVHASSLAGAQRLFDLAHVRDALHDTWCADAATLRLPDGYAPDVLVAEVMQRALAHEPQVAVTANLVPQCSSDAALVPKRIVISARLGHLTPAPVSSGASRSTELGPLLDLSLQTLPALSALLATNPTTLPERRLHVQDDAPPGLGLMLHTRIETMDGVVLVDDDSGLTTPQPLLALGPIAPGESLGVAYRLGRDPGFRVRRLSGSPA